MFLAERIIGVATYALILIIVFFKISKSKQNKSITKTLKNYWIILSILAFFYIPANSADLSRYITSAHIYSSYSFSELLKAISSTMAPMQVIYFYILGLTKVDGVIPAVSCMIFYGFTFSIFSDAIKRYNISGRNAALSLLFFMAMGSFLNVISIIRSCVAFSAIAYCCYFELIGKKKITSHIHLYMFSALMHPAAIVLIVVRILTIIFKKEKTLIRRFINYIFVIILMALIVRYGNDYINLIFEKSIIYIKGEVYSYIWEYIICFMYMIFSTYIIVKSKNTIESIELINFNRFLMLINIFIFIFCFEYSIFTRYQLFSSILFLPYFSIYINQLKSKSKMLTFMYYSITIIIFAIACTRGNLCGFKFLLFN